jgi:predicted amidohydrolase YtcJ
MLAPYDDHGGLGMKILSDAELGAMVGEAAHAGFSVTIHAIGDAAVRASLDAIETHHAALAALAIPPRIENRADHKIRDSARGEACTVRIVGACTHDPAYTIWSHAPLQAAGKGRGWKSIDLAGAYCCTACDAVIDGQRAMPPGATRDSVMLDWFMGHMRSLVILKQKGLV